MDDNEKIVLAKDFAKKYIQLRKTIMQAPQSNDIKPNEFTLLMLLIDSITPEIKGVKVSELSTILNITPAAVTHMINSLEKKEYLERLSNEKDRRIVLVRATEKGIKAIESMKQKFFNNLNELFDFLGEKDSKELLRIINLISDFHNLKKIKTVK
ncbi:MarR family transcriptional regulator [Clostridium sp. SHJSY1]|uniref:MarR family winged helix-turn-helix transcriptional regulator n=1 Tax=Clostridium sp. SHJSY1 TaxID=2942483 RepID=UPI002876D4FF|nr:MarR family transcriptional regulator [Clostridium sp. SHJSY1]MDS0525427.1 MarR family transcriptional regulator [Clostridium sp. SHJSY1]